MGSNLKGNPSDWDDRIPLDPPSDQREDNLTAAGTIDRCAGASSLPVSVWLRPMFWKVYRKLSNKDQF